MCLFGIGVFGADILRNCRHKMYSENGVEVILQQGTFMWERGLNQEESCWPRPLLLLSPLWGPRLILFRSSVTQSSLAAGLCGASVCTYMGTWLKLVFPLCESCLLLLGAPGAGFNQESRKVEGKYIFRWDFFFSKLDFIRFSINVAVTVKHKKKMKWIHDSYLQKIEVK